MTRSLTVLGQVEPKRERADALRNRARILDAAREVMKKRSLEELCMDELAVLAGVGKGTLYRRFADKQALLHALLDDDERVLQEDVKRRFAVSGRDPRAATVELLDRLFAFVVDHAHVLAAADASARGGARYTCAPYAWRHAVLAHHLARARRVEGDHDGTPDAAAPQLADMLLATMSGELVARALAQHSEADVRARAHSFFLMVIR